MIDTLIVNQSEVPHLLPMKECIEVMARAFAALARGEATLPQRQIVWLGRPLRSALGPDAGPPDRARRDRPEGRDLLPAQRGHRARLAPGRRPALRGRARAPARRHRRDLDHVHPHGRGQRPGHAPARARGRRATSPSSARASRRARTSRPCSRCARSGASASRARRPSGRASSPSASPSATASRSRRAPRFAKP